jgi:hypothetical protein
MSHPEKHSQAYYEQILEERGLKVGLQECVYEALYGFAKQAPSVGSKSLPTPLSKGMPKGIGAAARNGMKLPSTNHVQKGV